MFDTLVSASELQPGDVVDVGGIELIVQSAEQERSGSFVVKFTSGSAFFGLPQRHYRRVRRATISA